MIKRETNWATPEEKAITTVFFLFFLIVISVQLNNRTNKLLVITVSSFFNFERWLSMGVHMKIFVLLW